MSLEGQRARNHALALGSSLSIGETIRTSCQRCLRPDTFTITRKDDGIVWNCYSVHCGERGASSFTELPPEVRDRFKAPPKTYDGPLHPLRPEAAAYFRERFGIEDTSWIREAGERVGLFILGPQGQRRGITIRNGWKRHPESGAVWDPVPGYPKSMTFREPGFDGELISWHRTSAVTDRKVVITEDQISAQRVAELIGCRAVALCGCNVNAARVREIAQATPSEVVIALDPDATDTAFKIAREWGLAFRSTRVALLTHDPKDAEAGEIINCI